MNSKWGIYYLWMGLCIISTVIVYFFIPETTGIPVEEIGAFFGDEVVVHLTEDGHDIVESEKSIQLTKEPMVATPDHVESTQEITGK